MVSLRREEPAERLHVCISVFVFYFRCVGCPDLRENRQLSICLPAILRLFTVPISKPIINTRHTDQCVRYLPAVRFVKLPNDPIRPSVHKVMKPILSNASRK